MWKKPLKDSGKVSNDEKDTGKFSLNVVPPKQLVVLEPVFLKEFQIRLLQIHD